MEAQVPIPHGWIGALFGGESRETWSFGCSQLVQDNMTLSLQELDSLDCIGREAGGLRMYLDIHAYYRNLYSGYAQRHFCECLVLPQSCK